MLALFQYTNGLAQEACTLTFHLSYRNNNFARLTNGRLLLNRGMKRIALLKFMTSSPSISFFGQARTFNMLLDFLIRQGLLPIPYPQYHQRFLSSPGFVTLFQQAQSLLNLKTEWPTYLSACWEVY